MLIWTAIAVSLAILAIAIFSLTRDTTANVPRVTNRPVERAEERLREEGFKVGDLKEVQNEAPPETVLEQDPIAGEVSLDCSFLSFFCSKPEVVLTVSVGPGNAEVPATAGLAQDEATEKLEDAGFEVGIARANSAKVEEGLVAHSTPSGGSTAIRGSTVVLTISAGPKLTKVPILVGTQRSVAVQQIRGRGLVPSVSEESSSSPAGQVIRQSPSAGSDVEPGATISIVVSKGEEKASVPNVIGKLRADAVSAVREAGLDPSVEEEETDVASKVGKVTDQFPPPASELAPGAEVTLVVGKAAAAVPPEEEE